MSVTDASEHSGAVPRVREQARDVLVLMTFSAGVSVGTAVLLVLATGLGH